MKRLSRMEQFGAQLSPKEQVRSVKGYFEEF